MRRTWRKAKPKQEKIFRANQQIEAEEVFLINEEGERIGVVSTPEAIRMAREAELDLVEVDPKSQPPVAKIMDYGQFKYEREKKLHKQKAQQKKIETKGVRLSVRISQHDFQIRINQATKFLEKGHKLKIELNLRGRERQHPQKAIEIIKQFIEVLKTNEKFNLVEEQPLTKQGGRYTIVLVNKK
ncbi:translation initiation factor IF-3 [Candidatus Parcubacteria bacterium]|nr:MAG: translation initiation factor IF-3 [Candidatus Parcubacteria bacterium]